MTDVLVSPPTPASVVDEWFPCEPCVVRPESVTEYPHIADLPEDLRERIHAWERTVERPPDETGAYRSRWSRHDGERPRREGDGHGLVLKGDLLTFACTHCIGAPLDYLATSQNRSVGGCPQTTDRSYHSTALPGGLSVTAGYT